jgi:ATP-dependent protease HslVU (ClpYQ) peptidase subunit
MEDAAMTTIAVTSDEVAWDSMQTLDGDIRSISPTEKVQVIGNKILCFAGNSDDEVRLVEWMKKGAQPSRFPKFDADSDFEAIVIAPGSFKLYSEKVRSGVPVTPPLVLGSGGRLALGALAYMRLTDAPMSAVCAVRAAATVDTFTGGEIKSLRIKDHITSKPGRKRK